MITYHAIALGFIALGLKAPITQGDKKRKGLFSGMLIVSTYLLQGMIGLSLTLVLSLTVMPWLLGASGMLLPLGFGQGPGQALNIGIVYEQTYGFVGGASFGLVVASFGFIWASVMGVWHLNRLKKRNLITLSTVALKPTVSAQELSAPDEIPLAESIDKFTVQVILVLFVYGLTYVLLRTTTQGLYNGALGDFGIQTIAPLLWGFNFIIAMLLALALRRVFALLRHKQWMNRQYTNDFMLNRIAGFLFDLMIVASITAIRIEDLQRLWVPLIILVLAVGVATYYFVLWLTQRLYPNYAHAANMGMFGMLTGTASTGIILLREVDPNFETPAAMDLVVGSSTAILFGFPILLLVGIAPQSTQSSFIVLGLVIALFILFTVLLLKLNPKIES
jgi:ESS family glutamate:Na+ symporter